MNGSTTIATSPKPPAFRSAMTKAREMTEYLESNAALSVEHSELERFAEREGREFLRRLLEEHYALRALAERPVRVVGLDSVERTLRRPSMRGLLTIVGRVEVPRLAYQARGMAGLHPMDAALNLPSELYSHEVRRRVAEQAASSAFDDVSDALTKATGVSVGKRQIEQLAARGATDFDAFYAVRKHESESPTDLLVLTFDGKGVPMRREGLRPETRQAADTTPRRLRTRLTTGEKRHRKRMAQVAAVYAVAPYRRTVQDVLAELRPVRDVGKDKKRPRPTQKRVWASVEKEPAAVIEDAFEDALRRDPTKSRRWVVLLDGNRDQLRLVKEAAQKHAISITILVDLIHVLEYLWKAAYAFHAAATKEAEDWVQQRLLWLLRGEHGKVRQNLRRRARTLEGDALKPVTACLRYLKGVRRYLGYDEALGSGLPIATGVIEGACRYLVKDRMEKTGARWSLAGAEAVLRLRALWASHDFDNYWAFHLRAEYARHHESLYAASTPPRPIPGVRPRLRRVK